MWPLCGLCIQHLFSSDNDTIADMHGPTQSVRGCEEMQVKLLTLQDSRDISVRNAARWERARLMEPRCLAYTAHLQMPAAEIQSENPDQNVEKTVVGADAVCKCKKNNPIK